MIEGGSRKERFFSQLGGSLLSCLIGLLGGMFCGAIILSLCGLAGRSGTTGTEYLGYWHWGMAMVGAMYGGPVGAIAGPIAYILVLRTTGFKRAILPSAIGTIVCGFAGTLVTPLYGLPAGLAGFFIALLIVRFTRRVPHPSQPHREGWDH